MAAVAVLLATALPAVAQDTFVGCWARDYDAAHLAAHPAQVVRSMRLYVDPGPAVGLAAILSVVLEDQGRVRGQGLAGRRLEQYLMCFDDDAGRITCGVECDGGSFEVLSLTADRVDIRTSWLLVGDVDDCGGAVDIAEVENQPVTYRLLRAPDADCGAP